MDYERCEEERRGCINLAEHRCVSFTERYRRGTSLATQKDKVSLREQHLALLDYDTLFFELEQFKRERTWYNFNITKDGIKSLLGNQNWYTLYLPETRLNPVSSQDIERVIRTVTLDES